MKLTPEHLISLLTQYSENPIYQATERDTLKQAAEMIGEHSEIKPHLEAEIARLQKERDWAVAARDIESECKTKYHRVADYLFSVLENDEELKLSLYNDVDGYEWTITNTTKETTATDYYWEEAIKKLMEQEQ